VTGWSGDCGAIAVMCRERKVRVGAKRPPDDKLRVIRRRQDGGIGYATPPPAVLLSSKPLTVNLEPLMRSELA
jgi:hypothetical protein